MSSKPRDLYLLAAVLDQPGLSLLACAVLSEIIDLHKVNGHVFASDEHFAKRCKSKSRTIRVTIAELVATGYLIREVDYSARHKRRLTPTEKWQNPPELVADSATTSPKVVAESAGTSGEIRQDFRQNPPELVADSANINNQLNNKENLNQTPTPSEPEKKTGAGEFLEDSTPSLKAEVQIVPPVAEPPQEPAAPAPKPEPPRYSEASKELARKMASMWHITEQGNARKWMQLARFTHLMEQAGKLAEVARQFAGYSLYREKRRIEPYNLDKYLGSEGDGYQGEWCAFDWQAKGAAARADGDHLPPPPPKRASTSPGKNKTIW
jgi:hypothetical protein